MTTKTALGKLLAGIGDLRVLAAALAEADRAALVARAVVAAALGRMVGHPSVREAAQTAADATIVSRRDVRRRNIAVQLRTRGSRLVALAAEAETTLAGLALRIETDPNFLIDDAALFEAGESLTQPNAMEA